ncbi:hypothetical protein ACFQZ4_17965 [Catellatospora coxensis]
MPRTRPPAGPDRPPWPPRSSGHPGRRRHPHDIQHAVRRQQGGPATDAPGEFRRDPLRLVRQPGEPPHLWRVLGEVFGQDGLRPSASSLSSMANGGGHTATPASSPPSPSTRSMSRSDSARTMPSIRDCSSVSSWLLRTGSALSQGITAAVNSASAVSPVTLTVGFCLQDAHRNTPLPTSRPSDQLRWANDGT